MNKKIIVCLLIVALVSSCFARSLTKADYKSPKASLPATHDATPMVAPMEHKEEHVEHKEEPVEHKEEHIEHKEDHQALNKPIEHNETPLVTQAAITAEEAPVKAEGEAAESSE